MKHSLKAKQKATENIEQPLPKKVTVEKIVEEKSELKAPETVVSDQTAKLNPPPPEPTPQVDDDYPPQCSSEDVPVLSPTRQDKENPSKSVAEEGEIHWSEPSAQ